MSDNPIKKLRDSIENRPASKRDSRSNRTLSMREPQFSIFANYCKFKGITMSEIMDGLVAMYLEEVKNDLPPDPVPKKDAG